MQNTKQQQIEIMGKLTSQHPAVVGELGREESVQLSGPLH
jgi:hypothetical protein